MGLKASGHLPNTFSTITEGPWIHTISAISTGRMLVAAGVIQRTHTKELHHETVSSFEP